MLKHILYITWKLGEITGYEGFQFLFLLYFFILLCVEIATGGVETHKGYREL